MPAISPSVAIPPAVPTGSTPTAKASSASTSGSTTTADGGLGSTFLKLLSQELQNQDPTSPMDPTAMVGQMISLNQLDQLISINQELGVATGGANATNAVS
jgi:flagellar basal-body rod modification protein FlgD